MRLPADPAADSSRTEGKSLPPKSSKPGLQGKKVTPDKVLKPGLLPGVHFLNSVAVFPPAVAAPRQDAGRGGRRYSAPKGGGPEQRLSVAVATTAQDAPDRVAVDVTNGGKRGLPKPVTANFDEARALPSRSVREPSASATAGREKFGGLPLALPRAAGAQRSLTMPPIAALPPPTPAGEKVSGKPRGQEGVVATAPGLQGKKVTPDKVLKPGLLPGVHFLNSVAVFPPAVAAPRQDAGRGGRRYSAPKGGGPEQRLSVAVATTAQDAPDRVAVDVTNGGKRGLPKPVTANFDEARALPSRSVREPSASATAGREKFGGLPLALPRAAGAQRSLTMPPIAALPPPTPAGEKVSGKPRGQEGVVATALREMERSRNPRDVEAAKKVSAQRLDPVPQKKGESPQGLPSGLTQFISVVSVPEPAASGKTYGEVLAGHSHFAKAMGQHILLMLGQNRHEAILNLDPPHLGHLQIHLAAKQQNLNALFVSPNPDVRQALEAALPVLRQALAQQGVALAGAFVADGGRRHSPSDENARRLVRSFPLPGVTGLGAVGSGSYPGIGNRMVRGIINTYV